MIAATYTQNKGYQIEERPIPEIGEDELLIRVVTSSICGTDLRIIKNGHRKLRDRQTIVLGHEFAGIIEQRGRRVPALFQEGMRVGVAPNMGCGQCALCARGLYNMCADYSAFGINLDGAHAEYVRIPAAAICQGGVVPLPEAISFAEATLIEPLSCAVNGSRSVNIQFGDVVLVFGAGPIGLMHIMLARNSGASSILVADLQDHRLERAKAAGADVLIHSGREEVRSRVLELTGGVGADVVITACSVAEVQRDSVTMLAPFGRVCLFGGLPKDNSMVEFDTNLIHYRNLVVTGVTGGSPQDFRTAMALIAGKRVDTQQFLSHLYPRDAMDQAFETALGGETMKVAISSEITENWIQSNGRKLCAATA
jgi:L-iditol 2-dehydrogenase